MTAIQEEAQAPSYIPVKSEQFQTAEIVTIAGAHGAHDTFFAYLPTILPILIQNLALNATQAGLLSACTQIPNLLQPVIGHLADRRNLKLLVILAPAISGALITMIGLAPGFGEAALLLILAGFSTAGFHAIAPGLVSSRSGNNVGRGMGFFMTGGELGFGIGPLIVVAAIGYLTIRGLPWLMTFGMLVSFILWIRLKDITTVRPASGEPSLSVKDTIIQMRSIMIPIMAALVLTGFLNGCLVYFLPTFLSFEGVSFSLAGFSLAVVEISATIGVFLSGLICDRIGQRTMAVFGTVGSVIFGYGFLQFTGWPQVVMLVGVGLTAFLANPAFLAIIHGRFTKNRSLSNGIYMSSSFVLRSLVVILIGVLSDHFGMRTVFFASLGFSLLAIPVLYLLPKQ